MTSATDPAATSPGVVIKRFAIVLGILAALVLVPFLVSTALLGFPAATGAVLGSVGGFLIALTSGWIRGLQTLPLLLIALAASAVTGGSWWWVLCLTIIGALVGAATHLGWFMPMVIIGILFSVAGTAAEPTVLVGVVIACATGSLFGITVALLVGAPRTRHEARRSASAARAAAALFAVMAGAAGSLALVWGNEHSYWLPMTVFILAIPRPGIGASRMAVLRVFGTVLGVAAAWALTLLDAPSLATYTCAVVLLTFGVMVKHPAWLSPALSGAAVVLLLTPPTGGFAVGEARVEATIGGAFIILGAAGLVALISRYRSPTAPLSTTAADEALDDTITGLSGSAPAR